MLYEFLTEFNMIECEKPVEGSITISVDIITYVKGPLTEVEIWERAKQSILDMAKTIERGEPLTSKNFRASYRASNPEGLLFERHVDDKGSYGPMRAAQDALNSLNE